MTNEHGLQYACDETAQAMRLWKAVQDGEVKILPVKLGRMNEQKYDMLCKIGQGMGIPYTMTPPDIYKLVVDAVPAWEGELWNVEK